MPFMVIFRNPMVVAALKAPILPLGFDAVFS